MDIFPVGDKMWPPCAWNCNAQAHS